MSILPTDGSYDYGGIGYDPSADPSSPYQPPPGGGTANVPMWMQPWLGTPYAQAGVPSYGGGWSGVNAPAAYGGTFDYRAGSFDAPTGLTYMNDPGYQARMKMGSDSIEGSAAARGTLLTGDTARSLSQFGQDYGSNEFQNVYNRALSGYQANEANRYNAAALNQGGALQAYGINSGQQMQAAMANAQGRQSDAQFGYNAGLGAYDRTYQAYRGDQAAAFDRPYSLAQLGYNAASNASGQYGASSANNAQQMGNYWTGAGNANAAGQVASGNAWGNALGTIGNTAMGAYYANQYGGTSPYRSAAPPARPPAPSGGFATPNYGQYW